MMITFKQFLEEAEREIYAKKIEGAPEWSPEVAEKNYKVGKITFSAQHGFGSVGNSANVWYTGFVGFMKPSTFLLLALDDEGLQEPTSRELEKFHDEGYAIGIPHLYIQFDQNGKAPPKITGHEGRGRMRMIQRVNGDKEIPVQFFVRGSDFEMRAKNVKQEMIDEVKTKIISQRGKAVSHPVTKVFWNPNDDGKYNVPGTEH